ncbi:right-handed parallel beta-helix repeat-containing protein [Stenotrophomonas sp. HMSC10F06]|uniref:right-handed parallel beta-helix repeat-containing protein n=1 Tax=Stenotrophomonas sp. HMSC10F06 TaxID=1581081 RepID=UPI00111322C3|nr:right-handed parallel beta-helix repeat-containing protein [Stenotrophomonas sp. HMSC10F06]
MDLDRRNFLRVLTTAGVGVPLTGFAAAVATKDAESFGIRPQDPGSLQRGLTAAVEAGAPRVVVPPGVYLLPDPGKSPSHLRISDARDLVIEAQGATFICSSRTSRALIFEYCSRVSLRGAKFTRSIPPFSQGRVVAIAPQGDQVDVVIDEGYPTDIDDRKFFPHVPVLSAFVNGTRQLKPHVPDIYIGQIERLSPRRIRFHLRTLIDSRIPLRAGDPVAWRGGLQSAEITLSVCAGMTLDGVTVTNSVGMAFFEFHGEGGNTYRNCSVTWAEMPEGASSKTLLSSAADGLHSSCMRTGPRIEGCVFEGMNDDGVNIHGTWAMLAASTTTSSVVLDARRSHLGSRSPIPFAKVGDRLRFYSIEGQLLGERRVLGFAPKEEFRPSRLLRPTSSRFSDRSEGLYWDVILEKPIEAPAGGLVSNTDMCGREFLIRKSIFRHLRSRGILIRSSVGVVSNNLIEGTSNAGILVWPEVTRFAEPDYSHNVKIVGNTLRRVGIASRSWNSGLTIAGYFNGRYVPPPGGHRDIIISGNTFEDVPGANLVVTSAKRVTISGNKFISPMRVSAYRAADAKGGIDNPGALIWIRFSTLVSINHNIVSNPGKYVSGLVDGDDESMLAQWRAGINSL